ncbi:MAG: hypothetical protein KDB53_02645 [Planctomycetes bacterium]|nr:hypothetical protein [Planctomycetota bacterium]
MDRFLDYIYAIPWYAIVAIIAIVGGITSSIVRSKHRHAERMEMIKRGQDPGRPPRE